MNGSCLYVNRAWVLQTGLSETLSLGKGWFSALHPQDTDALLLEVKQSAISGKDRLETGLRVRSVGGEFTFHAVSITVDRDAAGDPVSFIGCILPSTGAKTRDFHALISSLEDIILEIDYHKVFRNVWAKNDDELFLPRDQFLNKTVDEVFGDKGALFSQVIGEVIRTGQPREFIYPGLYQFSHKWYRAKARPLCEDALTEGTPSLVVVIQEYTETQAYYEALEKAKRELEQGRRLLDTSEQLSLSSGWELDVASTRMTMTRQAYHIFGLEEDTEMTLDVFSRFYIEQDRAVLLAAEKLAADEQRNFDIELQITTPEGILKWVRLIGVPICAAGKVTTIVGAMMDITHKKAIEKELTRARILAENAAMEKTDFLSVMSHEIRTPVNNIIGLANLLKLEHLPGNEEYIDNLVFSSNQLLQLINDILSLHKIEAGMFEQHLVKTDLPQLVKNIKNQFIALAREKGISLEDDIDPGIPPSVMASPPFLAQVLNNLISNAVKFTERGTVTIRLDLQKLDGAGAHVRFSVRDTGMGIPASKQQAIFEQFKQLHATPGSKYPGTGLGLTITKKLIESQGSVIGLTSEPGKGTEFYFELRFTPAGQDDTAPRAAVVPQIEQYKDKLSGVTLLLVEDNPVNILITQKHLKYFGIVPDCAGRGEEALRLLEQRPYQLLLLDLHTPGPAGYHLAGLIRERYPATRVIVYTADSLTDEAPAMAALGIAGVLKKPFRTEELLAVLLKSISQG
jgi:PAS domain S-box-containing protein